MVRTGSLTNPVFDRRLRLALNLGGVGVILVIAGAAGVEIADPDWERRPGSGFSSR